MKIYLVTNRKICKGDYIKKIDQACRSGVDRVILREKDLEFKKYLSLGRRVKLITDKYKIPLIINGNLKVAKSLNPLAYHCSYYDFIKYGKSYPVTGVSIHSVEEAVKVEKLGADYILAGHIFETDCKKGLEARGIEFLRELRNRVDIPIIGIGGIGPRNISEIFESGADGFAVMSYIMSSYDGKLATRALKDSLEEVIGR